jgi:polar amino acid transport system substrate-binding protein
VINTHKIYFWFFIILMFPLTSQSSEPIELTLSYQVNPSPPYQMGTGMEVVEPPGIALDVINAAAKALSLKIVYQRYPNVRVLHLLENNQIDGAFMFSYKAERAEIARYPLTKDGKLDSSKRLATLSYWLYSLAEAELDWDGRHLFKVNGLGIKGNIVAEHGDSIISDLEKMGHKVQQPNSPYKALLMLTRRSQVVGAALQDVKAAPFLVRPEFSTIKRSSVPLKTKDYFLVLSNQFVENHPDIADALWQKIEELRDEVSKESMYRYTAFQ